MEKAGIETEVLAWDTVDWQFLIYHQQGINR